MKRLLVPATALWWGLQFAFLNPALALLLVTMLDATPAEVGWALAAYNGSGFIASLAVPAYADRTRNYLRPMVLSGLSTLLLAGTLAVVTTLPLAVVGLVLLGGPATVGSTLLFAHLKHSGEPASAVVNTRAVVSFAWVAGPPLATVLMGRFGERAVLAAVATVAVFAVTTTAALARRRPATGAEARSTVESDDDHRPVPRRAVVGMVGAFGALQAANATVVAVMGLYVTRALHLDVTWAGIALGVAAGLEIPALLLVARWGQRISDLVLLGAGGVAGIAYYIAMLAVSGPVALIAVQALNAVHFAAIVGVGLPLFQRMIRQPGLATGLYMNVRRLGAIASGPVIGFGSVTAMGYRGVLVVCAGLTVAALATILTLGSAAAAS